MEQGWVHKMMFVYCLWRSAGQAPGFEFTKEALAAYVGPTKVAQDYASKSVRLKPRIVSIRSIVPGRRPGASASASSV